MSIEKKIELVERNTTEFIDQIDKIGYNQDLGLVKFILVCCLIDATAAYRYYGERKNEQYKNFIKEYLGSVDGIYRNDKVASQLYHSIRCGLIHAFTIPKGILLTEANDPNVHLITNINGDLVVDLVTFYNHLKIAIRLFFKEVKKGKGDIQKQFKKAFADNPPFEIYQNVSLLNPTLPASGTTATGITTNYKVVNFGRKYL